MLLVIPSPVAEEPPRQTIKTGPTHAGVTFGELITHKNGGILVCFDHNGSMIRNGQEPRNNKNPHVPRSRSKATKSADERQGAGSWWLNHKLVGLRPEYADSFATLSICCSQVLLPI